MTDRDPRDTAAEREDRDRREDADASDESPVRTTREEETDVEAEDASDESSEPTARVDSELGGEDSEVAPARFIEEPEGAAVRVVEEPEEAAVVDVEDADHGLIVVGADEDDGAARWEKVEEETGSFERTTDEGADHRQADAADLDAGDRQSDSADDHPRLASSHDVTAVDAARGPPTSFDPDDFDADSLVDHGLTLGEAVPGGVKDQLAAGMSDGEIRQWLHDYANGFGIDTAGMNDQQLVGAVEQATRAELGGYDHVDTMPSRSAQQAADDYEMMGGTVTEDAQGNLTFHKATFGSEKGEALSTVPAGTDVDANQATANAALGLAHDALPTEVAKEIARDLINDPSHHLADIESVEVTGDSVIVTFTDGSTKTYQQGEVQDTQSSSTPSEDHRTSGSSSSDGSDDGEDDDDDDDDDGGGDEDPEAEDEVPDAADSAAGDEGEAGDEGMPSPADHHVDHEQAVEALLTNPAFAAEREVMIRGLEQQIGGGLIEVDLGSEQALHEFLLSPMGAETLRLMRMAVENQGPGGQTTPALDDEAIAVPDEHSLDNVALQAAGGGAAPPPGGFGTGAPGSDEDEDAPVGGPGPDIGGPGSAAPELAASIEGQLTALDGAGGGHDALGVDDDEDGIDPTIGSDLDDLGGFVE